MGCQQRDGGWGYQTSGSSANMATAGLATMFLVFDMYHGRSFYARDNPRPFATGDGAKCRFAIDRCMNWLGEHGGSSQDAYYLYGIERTGVASGLVTVMARGDEDTKAAVPDRWSLE